jgi:hypothetical protein
LFVQAKGTIELVVSATYASRDSWFIILKGMPIPLGLEDDHQTLMAVFIAKKFKGLRHKPQSYLRKSNFKSPLWEGERDLGSKSAH